MLTNKEALEVARRELSQAMYVVEHCDNNPGLRKIAENKSDWLVRLIQMSESYCNFHWLSASLLMPENALANAGKQNIPCIVAVKKKAVSEPVIEMRVRRKKRFGTGWEWNSGNRDEVVWWANLPSLPRTTGEN